MTVNRRTNIDCWLWWFDWREHDDDAAGVCVLIGSCVHHAQKLLVLFLCTFSESIILKSCFLFFLGGGLVNHKTQLSPWKRFLVVMGFLKEVNHTRAQFPASCSHAWPLKASAYFPTLVHTWPALCVSLPHIYVYMYISGCFKRTTGCFPPEEKELLTEETVIFMTVNKNSIL